MNIFYSEGLGITLEEVCTEAGEDYFLINSGDSGEDRTEINVNEIDEMISALTFARSKTSLATAKDMLAEEHNFDVNDIDAIDFFDIGSEIEGIVIVNNEEIPFKIPTPA